ncbi:C40 family peptidase [Actinomadura macrotermitis]|uniref:Peptidase C51 domain-containing protein n=1 Tax=Actinomadura macrotermitis TaxID=2585200 RepID=A0A7K0BMU8_9ACTN|nr:CHAP domain-containing protein [Actinomadura macrotermitis]MQY02495.1 hypothetical protein [Actinomadura macrotermitis]
MSGKHRKTSTLTLALRATGTLAAGLAVVGTVATTANAGIPVPGQDAPKSGPVSAAQAALVGRGVPAQAQGQAHAQAAPKARTAAKAQARRVPTADDAIKKALTQVGVKENRNGETKFQDWYMSTARAKETVKRDGGSIKAYNDAQWCDMFVSWVGQQIGFDHQTGQDAWTVAHAKWFKSQGRWGTTPKPGAIVFFAWDGGKSLDDIVHVGMVIKDNGNGTVRTVEGNTGNAVQVKTRDTDQIVGYGYPDYAK